MTYLDTYVIVKYEEQLKHGCNKICLSLMNIDGGDVEVNTTERTHLGPQPIIEARLLLKGGVRSTV